MGEDLAFLAAVRDIATTGEQVLTLVKDVNFSSYQTDWALRWSVERGLTIIGEAATRIRKLNRLQELPHGTKIIGFRNTLVHAYDSVNHATVWGILQLHLPGLVDEARSILAKAPDKGDTSFIL